MVARLLLATVLVVMAQAITLRTHDQLTQQLEIPAVMEPSSSDATPFSAPQGGMEMVGDISMLDGFQADNGQTIILDGPMRAAMGNSAPAPQAAAPPAPPAAAPQQFAPPQAMMQMSAAPAAPAAVQYAAPAAATPTYAAPAAAAAPVQTYSAPAAQVATPAAPAAPAVTYAAPAAPAVPAAVATPAAPAAAAVAATPAAPAAPAVTYAAPATPAAATPAVAAPAAAAPAAVTYAAPAAQTATAAAAPAAPATVAAPMAQIQTQQQTGAQTEHTMVTSMETKVSTGSDMDNMFGQAAEMQDEEGQSIFGQIGTHYTYLMGGDDWNANSEVSNGYSNPPMKLGDCQKKCLEKENCVVGMWGTSGKRKGQCWLSSVKREASIPCLAPCLSFEKRDVSNHNHSPVVRGLREATATKSVMFQMDLSPHFSDPDGDALQYRIEGIPEMAGLSINSKTGILAGTPTQFAAEAMQPFFMHVVAEDGKGGKTQGTLRLTVQNPGS